MDKFQLGCPAETLSSFGNRLKIWKFLYLLSITITKQLRKAYYKHNRWYQK